MNVEEITKQLFQLAEKMNLNTKDLNIDDDLFEKLGINSLQAVELLTAIEIRFGIEVPDYEMKGVSTFSQLAELVKIRL